MSKLEQNEVDERLIRSLIVNIELTLEDTVLSNYIEHTKKIKIKYKYLRTKPKNKRHVYVPIIFFLLVIILFFSLYLTVKIKPNKIVSKLMYMPNKQTINHQFVFGEVPLNIHDSIDLVYNTFVVKKEQLNQQTTTTLNIEQPNNPSNTALPHVKSNSITPIVQP